MSGFNVVQVPHADNSSGNIRKKAHEALEMLIKQMEDGDSEGGEIHLGNGERIFRLTFCDFTDQKPCVWCAGTGVDGS